MGKEKNLGKKEELEDDNTSERCTRGGISVYFGGKCAAGDCKMRGRGPVAIKGRK